MDQTRSESALAQNYSESSQATLVNLRDAERWLCGLGGTGLILYGLARRGILGLVSAAAGGSLIYRCIKQSSHGQEHENGPAVKHGQGFKTEHVITVNRPRQELYNFWRDFTNLPKFMSHLSSVRRIDDKRSHWIAEGPMGMQFEWDAEIFNEREGQLIAWRSLEGSEIPNAGAVRFDSLPDGRSTEIRVVVNYVPPAGSLGNAIAWFFGENPEQQIEEDLRLFKSLMESGETSGHHSAEAGR